MIYVSQLQEKIAELEHNLEQARNAALDEAKEYLKTRIDFNPIDAYDEGFNAAIEGDIAALEYLKTKTNKEKRI